MSFEIKPATRVGIKPLVGLYGESGTGKTMSALLLARGVVGPSGKIVMIDTESGRGSLYADVIPGGYDVLNLDEPFTPDRYTQALQAAEKGGAQIVVIDSQSHSWEGVGGVLDMAAKIEERSGPGLHCWKDAKLQHARMMLRLLQSPLPVIVCIRAKYKSRQVRGTKEMADAGIIRQKDVGRSVIVKDECTTPIQDEAFIYEMTAHAEVLKDHSIILTKCSHPSLGKCFPSKGPITIEHGELLAKWCAAPGVSAPSDVADKWKAEAWAKAKAIHGGDAAKFRQHLVDEALIDPDTQLKDVTSANWKTICAKL